MGEALGWNGRGPRDLSRVEHVLLQLLSGAVIILLHTVAQTCGNEYFSIVHFVGYVNHTSIKTFSKHQLVVLSAFFMCKMGTVKKEMGTVVKAK